MQGEKEHEGLHLHFAKADVQHLRWAELALQPNPLMYWPRGYKCWKGLSDEPSPIPGRRVRKLPMGCKTQSHRKLNKCGNPSPPIPRFTHIY